MLEVSLRNSNVKWTNESKSNKKLKNVSNNKKLSDLNKQNLMRKPNNSGLLKSRNLKDRDRLLWLLQLRLDSGNLRHLGNYRRDYSKRELKRRKE